MKYSPQIVKKMFKPGYCSFNALHCATWQTHSPSCTQCDDLLVLGGHIENFPPCHLLQNHLQPFLNGTAQHQKRVKLGPAGGSSSNTLPHASEEEGGVHQESVLCCTYSHPEQWWWL